MTAIILAAGQSKRMKSGIPKVAHSILGVPIIKWIVGAVRAAGVDRVVIVTGFGASFVESLFRNDVLFVRQEQQLGTGHAVMMAADFIDDEVLVIPGDVPLITGPTLCNLIEDRRTSDSDVSILTFAPEDPAGYGRIVRENDEIRIVEDADLNDSMRDITEVNSSIYAFSGGFLKNSFVKLSCNNAQGEYYLTDIVVHANSVSTVAARYDGEVQGVNDRIQLAKAQRYAQEKINLQHMKDGVTIVDPNTTYIAPGVKIGQDSVIEPCTFILGNTVVGKSCAIGPMSRIVDSEIEDNVSVVRSEVEGAEVGRGAAVGPFSRIRPGTVLERETKIGNFVEVKNSRIGQRSKALHLSYIGDAYLGDDVNIGAGTITCNYDGKKKHKTIIEDGAFVGSNTALVAPIKIGEGSVVAAGSTITEDVPPFSLALARSRQVIKTDKYRQKTSGKENEK